MFKKKEEGLSDQLAVYHEREKPRFAIKAGISIDGFEGEGKIDNISVSGCRMESVTYAALAHDQVYQARIIPDDGEKLDPFNIKLKLNWTKSSEALFQAGFTVESGQSNAQLNQCVEKLQAGGAKPDYGNMNPDQKF